MYKLDKLLQKLEEFKTELSAMDIVTIKNFKDSNKVVEEPKEEVKDTPIIKLAKSCLEITADIETLQEDANMFCYEQFDYYIGNQDELDRGELIKIKNALDRYYRMYRRIEAFLNRHKED